MMLSNVGVITYAPTQIGPEFSLQEIQGQRLDFYPITVLEIILRL